MTEMTSDPKNVLPNPDDDKSWKTKALEMFGINVDPAKGKGDAPQFEQIAPLQIPGTSSDQGTSSEDLVEEITESSVEESSVEPQQDWGDKFFDEDKPASKTKQRRPQEFSSDDFGGSLLGFEDEDNPTEELEQESTEEIVNMSIEDEGDFGFDEIDDEEINAIDIEDENMTDDDIEDDDNEQEDAEVIQNDLPEDSYWDALDDFHWKETEDSETAHAVADDANIDEQPKEKSEKKHKSKKEKSSKDRHKKKKKEKKKKELTYLGKGEAETTAELLEEFVDDDFGLGLMEQNKDASFVPEEVSFDDDGDGDFEPEELSVDIESEEEVEEPENDETFEDGGFGFDIEEEEKPKKRRRRSRRRKPRSKKPAEEILEEDDEIVESLVENVDDVEDVEDADDSEEEEERPRKRPRRRHRKKVEKSDDDGFGGALLDEDADDDDFEDDEDEEKKPRAKRQRSSRSKTTRKVSDEYKDLPTWEEAISHLLTSSNKSGAGRSNPTRKPRPKKTENKSDSSDSSRKSGGSRSRRRRPSK